MDEVQYKLLRLVEAQPDLSQRELAREMGVSLGKVNYCMNALIEQGWVKARNFRTSRNKRAYAYLLTPKGAQQKASLAMIFLRIKIAEYESLKSEISKLRAEAGETSAMPEGDR